MVYLPHWSIFVHLDQCWSNLVYIYITWKIMVYLVSILVHIVCSQYPYEAISYHASVTQLLLGRVNGRDDRWGQETAESRGCGGPLAAGVCEAYCILLLASICKITNIQRLRGSKDATVVKVSMVTKGLGGKTFTNNITILLLTKQFRTDTGLTAVNGG